MKAGVKLTSHPILEMLSIPHFTYRVGCPENMELKISTGIQKCRMMKHRNLISFRNVNEAQ